MTTNAESSTGAERYRPLGLIANPFVVPREEGASAVDLEVAAASHRLFAAIAAAASAGKARPIVVRKTTEVPSSYPLRAISLTEALLIDDDPLGVVHAYIQLYMMRKGRVRSTLAAVSERIAFRSFTRSLACFIERILENTDDQLTSYQVMGPETLMDFTARFSEDPIGVTTEYFGEEEIERRPELATVADIRLTGLETDIEESEDTAELDATVGNAPGTGIGLPEVDDEATKRQTVVDYLIEYASTHLSKVVARGLRVYRERGLAAMVTEWRVTKAPRKTLSALVDFAATNFNKVAVIYDGFESWMQIPSDLRHTIVVTLSEMRWMLEENGVFVFLLEEGVAPELEEQFSGGEHLAWDFSGLLPLQNAPDVLDTQIVDAWIAAATIEGEPITMTHPVLAAFAEKAAGSLRTFIPMAAAAIEDAVSRNASELDDESLKAGLAKGMEAVTE